MRITKISVKDVPPINNFEVSELSDLVIFAGANGVGKTRLIETLLSYFRNYENPKVHISLQATDKKEKEIWKNDVLHTTNRSDITLLKQLLQTNRRRRNFKSSILYFESDRSIQKIKPLQFAWDFLDPWDENISWDFTFSGLRNRFQDTLHAIFKKYKIRRQA